MPRISGKLRNSSMGKVLAIRRDDTFSPHSIGKDKAILMAVLQRLGDCQLMDERVFDDALKIPEADAYLSMGRFPKTLERLSRIEKKGKVVVNRGESVRPRYVLEDLMRKHQVAMPPEKGTHGYWLKNGGWATGKDDVVFCQDEQQLREALSRYRERGITHLVVSAHVVGDLVKWYAVGENFFRYYYPNDDGISKFGDERRNGQAHHYPFDVEALHQEVVKVARLTGIDVYGGDAIIDQDGNFYVIDFNDWPSFSRCREQAADAIADLVSRYLNEK